MGSEHIQYGLNDNEKKVLSKGLNYAVTPDRIPKEEYIVATEKACKMLSTAEGEQLRAQVVGALNQAKPPKSNISKGARQALRTLAKGKSVTNTASRQRQSDSNYGNSGI